MARDLRWVGSLLTLADLERHQDRLRAPLALAHSLGTVYNMPPPTQGLVSLLILGILDRASAKDMDPLGPEFVHACVEATKLAFHIRDRHITDPDHMQIDPLTFLDPVALDEMAARVSMTQAAPRGRGAGPGDTVWLGTMDADGVAVRFFYGIYPVVRPGGVPGGAGKNRSGAGWGVLALCTARNSP